MCLVTTGRIDTRSLKISTNVTLNGLRMKDNYYVYYVIVVIAVFIETTLLRKVNDIS